MSMEEQMVLTTFTILETYSLDRYHNSWVSLLSQNPYVHWKTLEVIKSLSMFWLVESNTKQ